MQYTLHKHLAEVNVTWKGSFYNNNNSFGLFSKPICFLCLMKENLFIAGIIYLHLVIYAIIYLNADLRIHTNARCPSQSF